MKQFFEDLGAFGWFVTILVMCVFVGFGLWAALLPKSMEIQNDANHNSPGYYAAQIKHLQTDIRGYNTVPPDSEQAKYLVTDFCSTYQDKSIQNNPNNPIDVEKFADAHC